MIKKRKTITNKKYQSTGFKKKMGKSQTLPDQNLTIQELLDRHSRGVSLGAPDLKGEYFDTEIPRFDDLTDMLQYKKDLIQKEIELKEIALKELSLKQKESEVEDSQAEKEAEASEEKSPSK